MAAWKSGRGELPGGVGGRGGAVPILVPVPISGASILPGAHFYSLCKIISVFPVSLSCDHRLGTLSCVPWSNWDMQHPHGVAFWGLRAPGLPEDHTHPPFPSHPFQGCSPSPRARCPPLSSLLIFPRHSQEGNTFLIFFRRVVRPCCPSPPAPALLFSGVSLHFSPETPQPNISLLEGKGKSPRRG